MCIYTSDTLSVIIHETKRLVDRDGFASVEVIAIDECGEEVLCCYNGESEMILN